ncbi:hypothetical protein E4U32_005684 [Claviceps aff. humidiphila group G2b]|nr:hypothetical protein E4U32_005684 [Claviceps aff. humidiphila group G2b]
MIGRLTFHHLVSLGCNFCLCIPVTSIFDRERGHREYKNQDFAIPSILSLSLSLTHTHTSLFISCKYFTSNNFLLAIRQNEAHLSRASHLLCRHRRSSHASHR